MGWDLALYIGIGFFAQIVDGALGMAFGIIASTGLIAFGMAPPAASAAIHAAEVATTAVSGGSHIWYRNVSWPVAWRLALPGVIGGALGAYVLTGLPEEIVLPLVTIYLAAMAALIFARVMKKLKRQWNVPVPVVGAGGGFLDAVGGGGWGPLVSSTMLASGEEARRTIGTVNTVEFAVAVAVSLTFLTRLDLSDYARVVLGLVIGGGLAAPLAGYIIKILPMKVALVLVGCVIAALTAFNVVTLLT